MPGRPRIRRSDVVQSLGFVPALIVVAFAGLAVALVEVDEAVRAWRTAVLFHGDADAARTLLSVIAGSLITVAGLVFSMTLVVLQLASTQFSPRVLRTFFGDRLTHVTIGAYVGTFVFALFVLRSVGGSQDGGEFVPRLSITVASALGIGAVVLLIVFLHHVSQLIQVSHVMRRIARETLEHVNRLHPTPYAGPAADEAADDLLERWRAVASGRSWPEEPGFVERVHLERLVADVAGRVERLALLVQPGDFVSVDTPLAEVWPAEAAGGCTDAIRDAVEIGPERSPEQDVGFGLRQLTDTAVRAMSPSMNDPTTAVTCVGYLRSILTRLSERALPAEVHRLPDRSLTVVPARRRFEEHLDSLREVARHARSDPRVARELLLALHAVARAAAGCGAGERAEAVRRLALTIASQAAEQVSDEGQQAEISRIRGEIAALTDGARASGSDRLAAAERSSSRSGR